MKKLRCEKRHYIVLEYCMGDNGYKVTRADGNYDTYDSALLRANKYEQNKTSPKHVVVISMVEGADDVYSQKFSY